MTGYDMKDTVDWVEEERRKERLDRTYRRISIAGNIVYEIVVALVLVAVVIIAGYALYCIGG